METAVPGVETCSRVDRRSAKLVLVMGAGRYAVIGVASTAPSGIRLCAPAQSRGAIFSGTPPCGRSVINMTGCGTRPATGAKRKRLTSVARMIRAS